jgi:hypothetical protein
MEVEVPGSIAITLSWITGAIYRRGGILHIAVEELVHFM